VEYYGTSKPTATKKQKGKSYGLSPLPLGKQTQSRKANKTRS